LPALASHQTVLHHSPMTTKKVRHSRGLPHSSIDLLEMLPSWAQVIVCVVGVVGFFYGVAHYGLGRMLLRAIFGP
jgi:hypothetical protein